jgi:hypothetical protein
MPSIRLGDLLVKARVISETQLKSALIEQQKWGGRLGEILVRMRIVSEEMLVKALAKQLNVPSVDVDILSSIEDHVRSKIPIEFVKDLSAIPLALRDDNRTLVVAMSEPQNIKHLDTLRSITGCRILPQLAGQQAIGRAVSRFYESSAEVPAQEGSFKVLDAQGNALVESLRDAPQARAAPPVSLAPSGAGSPRGPERSQSSRSAAPAQPAPGAQRSASPADRLSVIEEAQRKEVAALKALVSLLIEHGIFSREEYLARVKR